MLCGDRVEQFVLRARRQGGDGCHVGLRRRLHAHRGRADLRARLPGQQQQQLVAEADPVEPQQIAPQIDAGVQVDIHRVAAERAQEETGGSDRQGLAAAFQRQPVGQGLGHQHRNIGKDVDPPDGLAELADRRRLILAAALAEDAAQQLVLFDQRFDRRQRRRASDCSGRPGNGSQSAPPAASAPAAAPCRERRSRTRATCVPGNMK